MYPPPPPLPVLVLFTLCRYIHTPGEPPTQPVKVLPRQATGVIEALRAHVRAVPGRLYVDGNVSGKKKRKIDERESKANRYVQYESEQEKRRQ